jgi:hypothetical protein
MPIFAGALPLFIHIPKNASQSIEQTFMDIKKNTASSRPNLLNRTVRFLEVISRSLTSPDRLVGTQDIPVAAQHLTFGEIVLPDLELSDMACIPHIGRSRVISACA